MSLRYRATKKVTRARKAQYINELLDYFSKYKYLIVGNLVGLGSSEIQELRKIIRNYGILKVAKNSLVRIALEKKFGSELKEKLEKKLVNQNCFIFTNLNPYEFYLLLEKNKIYTAAQPGMKAPVDIVIPSGNTGLTPGPLLSKFSKLKIPTKIEEGSVWITKDTVVTKQGSEITKEVVELLNLLNIKPIAKNLQIKFFFDGRSIVEGITLDVEAIRKDVIDAYSNAVKLAINATLPVPEILHIILSNAQANAIKILQSVVLPEKESLKYNVIKAHALAKSILDRIETTKNE